MTLKEQMAADVTAVFFNTDEFADLGTLKRSADGSEVANVPFIIEVGLSNASQDYGAADMAIMTIPAAAANPAPVMYDTITKGSVIYTLNQRLEADDDVLRFSVEAEERHRPR